MRNKGGTKVEERIVVTTLENIVRTLGALAAVALAPDDPLALPDPPTPEEAAAYEGYISTMKEQVKPSYHPLLAMSLRDYRAGYADRSGAYLMEFLEKLKSEPDFTQTFSPEAQTQLELCRGALTEL
jgi:hypothetical protein